MWSSGFKKRLSLNADQHIIVEKYHLSQIDIDGKKYIITKSTSEEEELVREKTMIPAFERL